MENTIFSIRIHLPGPFAPYLRSAFALPLLLLLSALWGRAGGLADWVVEYAKFDRYSVKDGLSQNSIYWIAQDHTGYLWLATQDGLNRFDGYSFRVFRPEEGNPHSISGRTITVIMVAADGALWVGTQGEGVNRFNPSTQTFDRFLHDPAQPDSLSSDLVRTIVQDRSGTIWVGTENGLNYRGPEGGWKLFPQDPNGSAGLSHHSVQALALDPQDHIWVGTAHGLAMIDNDRSTVQTWNNDAVHDQTLPNANVTALACQGDDVYVGTSAGFALLNRRTKQVTSFLSDGPNRPPMVINQLLVDRDARLWVAATDGLSMFNAADAKFTLFGNALQGNDGLPGNVFYGLFQDASGIMWVGTEGAGLSKLNPYGSTMVHVSPSKQAGGLPHGVVLSLYVDHKGRFWITTDGGGLVRFDPSSGRFFDNYTQDLTRPDRTPSSNNLWSIAEDSRGILWLPSRNGLNRFDPETGQWRHYFHDPKRPESLAMSKSYSAIVDDQNRLWVATFGNGLDRMEDESGVFHHYPYDPRNPNGLTSGLLLFIGQDRRGHIWVGTYGSGLNLYRPESDDFKHFQHDPDRATSLPEDTVGHLFHDSQDRLWFSTSMGFCRYHWETGDFTSYSSKQGLGDDNTYAIQEDAEGFLWISTNKGLSRFDPRDETFLNLDTSHNLQSSEFNQAACLNHEGLLYFGGVNGFNMFDPSAIHIDQFKAPIVLTSYKKNNGKVHLDPQFDGSHVLELKPLDRVVSFEFAALDFLAPARNRYAYVLEGFSKEVIDLGNKHDLTFTNLDPGDYTLHIRSANAEGVWNQTGLSVPIRVIPPFWRTKLAYLLYGVLLLLVLGGIWLYQLKRLQRAEQISERLRQLDRLKDEFLAHTSHELRPPLSGIIGIAESLLEGAAGALAPMLVDNLSLIVSNGRRLDNMVSDLLDFSRMKHHRLVLELTPVDVEAVCRVVAAVVEPVLDGRPVRLILDLPEQLPLVLADENRLHQILNHLLENAVKFTEKGEIRISARLKEHGVELTISDTGVGIPEDRQEDIFMSFQSLDGDHTRPIKGSGLGLTVTRQLVELHGSHIELKSTPGAGSRFSFSLPRTNEARSPLAQVTAAEGVERADDTPHDHAVPALADAGFHILVVDDERVNRVILKNLLSLQGYRVSLAGDGEEALSLVRSETRFDLILLDILMPRMTGFEVCRLVRSQFSLQELPIILLTTKNQVAEMHMGFSMGGNDYLTKPFSKDELMARVGMHLSLLDVHRNLESIVTERTAELAKHNSELEMLDTIVQAINRELRLEDLLSVALHECLRLFPQADSGSFLLLDPKRGIYTVAAWLGYPEAFARQVRMTPAQVKLRYKANAEELETGIFIIRNPDEETRPGPVRSLAPPKALLAMEVLINGESQVFLVLDNSLSSQGFSHEDVRRLCRFREHIVSAITRAHMLDNAAQSQRDLVEAAHMFGMADNASLVLHNMGNKLNSVNISVQMMRERMERAQWVSIVQRARQAICSNQDVPWLRDNPQAAQIVELFRRLFERVDSWKSGMGSELERLESQVNEVLEALRAQWDYTTIRGVTEPADLARLVQACTQQERSIQRHGVQILEHFEPLPLVPVQKVKLMRVIFCLLENAVDSILRAEPSQGGLIELRVSANDQFGVIEIEDNGLGLPQELEEQIFMQGFSTKQSTSGFGLHNCANAIMEMGGTLTLQGNRDKPGATATLCLPLVVSERRDSTV